LRAFAVFFCAVVVDGTIAPVCGRTTAASLCFDLEMIDTSLEGPDAWATR